MATSACPRDNIVPGATTAPSALREEREDRGVSVYFLPQESGVSEQTIHNYEKGLRHPTLERLARVSKALGLRTSEIIALAEQRNPQWRRGFTASIW